MERVNLPEHIRQFSQDFVSAVQKRIDAGEDQRDAIDAVLQSITWKDDRS